MSNGKRYTYQLQFSGDPWVGEWQIIFMGTKGYSSFRDPVVWAMPHLKEHDDLGQPPIEMRQKYEELLKGSGWIPEFAEEALNIVELMAASDEDAWDQPCAHGRRLMKGSVYCHNKAWLYAPSKCRRHASASVWHDTPWPHEGCPGFLANPLIKAKSDD